RRVLFRSLALAFAEPVLERRRRAASLEWPAVRDLYRARPVADAAAAAADRVWAQTLTAFQELATARIRARRLGLRGARRVGLTGGGLAGLRRRITRVAEPLARAAERCARAADPAQWFEERARLEAQWSDTWQAVAAAVGEVWADAFAPRHADLRTMRPGPARWALALVLAPAVTHALPVFSPRGSRIAGAQFASTATPGSGGRMRMSRTATALAGTAGAVVSMRGASRGATSPTTPSTLTAAPGRSSASPRRFRARDGSTTYTMLSRRSRTQKPSLATAATVPSTRTSAPRSSVASGRSRCSSIASSGEGGACSAAVDVTTPRAASSRIASRKSRTAHTDSRRATAPIPHAQPAPRLALLTLHPGLSGCCPSACGRGARTASPAPRADRDSRLTGPARHRLRGGAAPRAPAPPAHGPASPSRGRASRCRSPRAAGRPRS